MIIVNKNTDKYQVYGGRGSIVGNPYVIGRDGTREQVIDRFSKEWFPFLLRDRIFLNHVLSLYKKRVACFCVPKFKCHLEVVSLFVNNYFDIENDFNNACEVGEGGSWSEQNIIDEALRLALLGKTNLQEKEEILRECLKKHYQELDKKILAEYQAYQDFEAHDFDIIETNHTEIKKYSPEILDDGEILL